jgi:putative membrane protein
MYHWDAGWHMGWMGIGWIVLIALAVAVVWAIARGTRGLGGPVESARDVVKRRYANGEIDRETYERMLRDLQDLPPSRPPGRPPTTGGPSGRS